MEYFLLSLQIWAASVSPLAKGYEYTAQQFDTLQACQEKAHLTEDFTLIVHGSESVIVWKCILRQET